MCPSVAVSGIKLVSTLDMGFIVVKWLTCCDVVVLEVAVSRLRHLLSSLRLLLADVSVCVEVLGSLQLLVVKDVACYFCNGGPVAS